MPNLPARKLYPHRWQQPPASIWMSALLPLPTAPMMHVRLPIWNFTVFLDVHNNLIGDNIGGACPRLTALSMLLGLTCLRKKGIVWISDN
jgi:hypothetical protein